MSLPYLKVFSKNCHKLSLSGLLVLACKALPSPVHLIRASLLLIIIIITYCGTLLFSSNSTSCVMPTPVHSGRCDQICLYLQKLENHYLLICLELLVCTPGVPGGNLKLVPTQGQGEVENRGSPLAGSGRLMNKESHRGGFAWRAQPDLHASPAAPTAHSLNTDGLNSPCSPRPCPWNGRDYRRGGGVHTPRAGKGRSLQLCGTAATGPKELLQQRPLSSDFKIIASAIVPCP